MNWFKHASPEEYEALISGHAITTHDGQRIVTEVLRDLVEEVERQRQAIRVNVAAINAVDSAVWDYE